MCTHQSKLSSVQQHSAFDRIINMTVNKCQMYLLINLLCCLVYIQSTNFWQLISCCLAALEMKIHYIQVETEEVYFTGIDVRESVIRVPTDQELLRIIGNGTGPVIVISVYYRNMTGLLPGTLPGGNDSILASPVLSTSLQCGERICDTADIELSLPVIITLPHTGYVQVPH